MKHISAKTSQSLFLMIEAALIFAGIIIGQSTKVGIACYWVLVAFYHLLDFAFGAAKDHMEDKDAGK